MTNRNVNLDLIKCIACFAIVGLHAVGMNNYSIYYLCGCGVPLFFMVNGFLMFSKDSIDYPYIFRKLFQILKVVFFWNLLITIPVFIFRQKFVNPFVLSFNSLLQKGYLWHFWFFGSLILVYLILPALHRFCKRSLKTHVFTLIVCFSICLCISILSIKNCYPVHAYFPQTLRLWIWLFFFTAGGFIPAILPRLRQIPIFIHTAAFLCAAIINNQSIKYIGLFVTQSRLAEYYYDYFSSILYYVLFFTLLLRIPIKDTFQKTVSFASSLTMGIFILHPILLTGADALCPSLIQTAPIAFWILLTLLSALITYVISKIPVLKEFIKLG